MATFLQQNMHVVYVLATIFGICIGSFLNVVIYRLPKILRQQWHNECLLFLNLANEAQSPSFSLAHPRSFCPNCKKKIAFYRNIPLISFLLQRGRCANCRQCISWRYPFVELLTGLAAGFAVYKFGLSWIILPVLIFTGSLIVLIFIDIDYQLLPDNITLPLLWLGLFCNLFQLFVPLDNALLGAILGYLILWVIGKIYFKFRHIEGIGYGDYKLLAMLGAWTGASSLPLIVLVAAVAGIVGAVMGLLLKKIKYQQTLPFGPYLAVAGWIALCWNTKMNVFHACIIQHYFN